MKFDKLTNNISHVHFTSIKNPEISITATLRSGTIMAVLFLASVLDAAEIRYGNWEPQVNNGFCGARAIYEYHDPHL